MKNVLVVFYSRTGTTKKVGEEIAKQLGCGTEQILDVKERKGPLGYMRSGKEAMKKIAGDIREPKEDPSKYDLVIIGTPIWSWNVSSPVRAYLEKVKDGLTGVAFFATQGGSGAENAFKSMEEITDCVPKATLALTTKFVQAGGWENNVKNFITKLK